MYWIILQKSINTGQLKNERADTITRRNNPECLLNRGNMETKRYQSPHAVFLSLCNLNIFGLGYLLSGQKKRWLFSLIGNLILLAVGHQTNASKNPALWAGIFLAVFLGMAVDLWLILKKKPELIAEKLTKNVIMLPLTAILVNLVFFGGFFLYRSAGNNLIVKGDQSFEAGNFEISQNDYFSASELYKLSLNPAVVLVSDRLNEISTILAARTFLANADYPAAIETIAIFDEHYPESAKKNEMMALGVDTYLAWANDLREKNEFENSLAKLDIAAKGYAKANPARLAEINNAIALNYLQWGTSLLEKKDFDAGIEKLEVVVNQYSQSDSFELAYEAAAQAYYDEAISLINSSQGYEAAVAYMNIVINTYSKSGVVEQALTKIPTAVLGWGKTLNNKESYFKALEKYDEIKALTKDTAILTEVESEIQKTIQLLARDVGGDGEVEILYTLQETCAGFPATRATIDLFPEEPGKALACDGNDFLIPPDLIADMPGTFRFIIAREDGGKRIQSCPYTGGHTLERWVNTSLITVKKVKNGDVVTKKTFTGAPPSSCPYEYAFYADTDLSWGDWVENADITIWLEKVIK